MLVPSHLQELWTLRAPIPHALPQRLNWAIGLVHRCLRWLLQCTRYGSAFPLSCLPHPLTLGWSHHSTAILSSQEYAPKVHGGLLTHTVSTLHSWLSFSQSNIHPTISPCWVLTALFLIITLVPWPLYSPFPLSSFLVSCLQILFPNSSLWVQQLTSHR